LASPLAGPPPAVAAPDARTAAAIADSTITVILVRHAEKNPHPAGGDAGLSPQGILRAQMLVHTLEDAGVRAVYATPFGRARQTALPLARAIGDSVHTYDADRPDELVRRIRAERFGQTVVIVGHSDTLPQTFEALTGDQLPPGEIIGYDRLYVVLLRPDGGYRLLRLRFGPRSG